MNLIITNEFGWFKFRGRLFDGNKLIKDIQSHTRQDIIKEVEEFLDGTFFKITEGVSNVS